MAAAKEKTLSNRIKIIDELVQCSVDFENFPTSIVSQDGLLDSLLTLYEECTHEHVIRNKYVAAFVRKYSATITELQRLRVKFGDFEVKDVIGRGHFGEVRVVTEKSSDRVYAMKILHKHETLAQQEISFFEEERDIMAKATSPWITRLYFAFQDHQNLYLVMEFLAGGDLLSLLSRNDDIFEEDMARFYLAEMTLAINSLHCMGYVHRDIKPENILLDWHGHVKLADFGSSAKLSPDMLVSSRMPVGTPDYVSPELLTSMNDHHSRTNYGVEVDWWSLGICMYEMLFGKTPFTDENGSMVITYSNIMNYQKCLSFPDDNEITVAAIDLIRKLLTDKNSRLTYKGMLKHKFFSSIRFENIREETPPFVPHLNSLDDTSNFEEFEKVRYQPAFDTIQPSKDFSGKDLPFVGFTFVRKEENETSLKSDTSISSESSGDTVYQSLPPRSPKKKNNCDTSVNVEGNYEVTLTVKIKELQNMRQRCNELEESECTLKNKVEKLKMVIKDKDEELTKSKMERDSIERELQTYITKAETLNMQLSSAVEDKEQMEWKATQLLTQIKDMTEEARQIEEEILRTEVEELQEVVVQLETDKDSLLKKLSSRDKQLELYREQLSNTQSQMAKLQYRLDKERRKSRDDQKRDLAVLETREEMWRTQVDDKNSDMMEMKQKIQELEDLVEAYEMQEKEYMEREQKLLQKLETTDTVDKVELRVLVKTSSPDKKVIQHNTKELKKLEKLVEKHETEEKQWEITEENLKDTIEKLKADVEIYKQKGKITSQTTESLKEQVKVYQNEVTELRQRLKDVQESVKQCMADEDKKQKQGFLEKQVKELELEVEMLHDDKRRLLQDVVKHQQEANDNKLKVSEQERTITRHTNKLERLERQLNEARDREIDIRVKAREQADLRNKLSEERLQEIKEENYKLQGEILDLKKDISDAKGQVEHQKEHKEEVTKLRGDNEQISNKLCELQKKLDEKIDERYDLLKKIDELKEQNEKCQRSEKSLKNDVEEMDKKLKNSESKCEEMTGLRREILTLKNQVQDLEKEAEKGEKCDKIQREKDSLQVKLENLEKELKEQKSLAEKRWSKLADAEDLRQENRYLESKIKSQQHQAEQFEIRVKNLESELQMVNQKDNKIKSLCEQLDCIRLEKRSMEVKLKELQMEVDQKQKQTSDNKKDVSQLEEKLQKEKEKHDKTMLELRRELQDANLALSEARSLLAANQRQENSLRERFDGEIRDLQMRLHRAESVPNSEEDLKLVKSQNDKLNRQIKELEDKVFNLQKERSAALMERQMLKDTVLQKEHQCELEVKKVEKLQNICGELEGQLKDLEALSEEYEKRQEEWNNIRATYEQAVSEREHELEGTSSQLQALQQARQSASEKVQGMKQQVHSSKAAHKAEVEALNHQLWEVKRSTQKLESQIVDLKDKNAKLQMIAERQTVTIEADVDDKRKLKEEISTIITENQDLRSNNLKLKKNLEDAMDKFELIFGEKVDLENFAEALQGLHFLEKYKFESTLGQQMKLIDYLQQTYAENNDKKKKGGKKFGSSSRKEKNVASPKMILQLNGDLQATLDLERKRNAKLNEQMEKLRQENFSLTNELLSLKGPLRDKIDGTLTPNTKAAMSALVCSPSTQAKSALLLTPSCKRSSSIVSDPLPTPQRMHHNIPHRFVTGLNTQATKCAVCLGSVAFVKQASKCQECKMVCHPKCTSSAQATCGLPTDYIQHFTGIMNKINRRSKSGNKYSPVLDPNLIKMTGWLKIPRTGKLGWDRRWGVLENNILMLYNDDTDANPVDTFDLKPPETDVTIHSSISTAELPNTASTDLPYVFKLEHEPLTTCWPGRILYLMADSFSDKQKWVASLEAAVKNLQRVDAVRRSKLQVNTLLELYGDRRLEVNCSLVLSNEMILLGAEEGLFAVNAFKGKHTLITKLSPFPGVHLMKYIPSLGMIIMIMGKNRQVVSVEKRYIKLRLGQAVKEETEEIMYKVVESIDGCTILDTGRYQDSVYLCAGTSEQVILMKYNTELRAFCVRKALYTMEPCSCVCMAEDLTIIGTEKFYRVDLEHPSLQEFVDKKDTSLAFAAFGAALHNSFPLAVVKVSPDGLPLEFLLCFHEFGVYVNAKGRRSRPHDMKWSCVPLSFAYSEPFLYVTYFGSVQAITVPADKKDSRGKQTSVDFHGARYLGNAITTGAIYVSHHTNQGTDLLCLRGNDGTSIQSYDDNKENRNGTYNNRFVSPKKSSSSVKSGGMRRNLSLTSLDSNSSVTSTCSVTSTDSKGTIQSDL